MQDNIDLAQIRDYFSGRFKEYGATPMGLDWNSSEAQNVRFDQLSKVILPSERFSLIDYGCGYGAFYDFLKQQRHTFEYTGYEIVEEMIAKAKDLHNSQKDCTFTIRETDLQLADYVVESGVFNIKLSADHEAWTRHVISTLEKMNALSKKGMAFNLLTKYSDPEFKRPDLYYADPCFYFDYCKRHFSSNVALLHDYEIYDFTIIVRKSEPDE